MRILALVMGAGALPAIAAPIVRSSQFSDAMPYADWLRSQLRMPASEGFEAALEEVSSGKYRSFQAFVSAFISAYEHQPAQKGLSAAFSKGELSDDALILYLQFRYQRLVGEAILSRSFFQAAASTNGQTNTVRGWNRVAQLSVSSKLATLPGSIGGWIAPLYSFQTFPSIQPLGP